MSLQLDELENWQRTDKCDQLTKENAGKECLLMGWVNSRRDHGGVIFVDLRDNQGITQIVFASQYAEEAIQKADALRSEWVVAIKGTVQLRSENTVNPKMTTGEIEVHVTELKILNSCQVLPFQISDEQQEISEKNRLKHRHLDLRRPYMQRIMMMRSKAAQSIRTFLSSEGFNEIETPVLTKSTPEGARDYLVPSRVSTGHFYALPQSPQLFKQMLMVAGYDKYFQIVKCFRDEDLRGNRQPEFTQVDLEMSFVGQEQVMDVTERMIAQAFKDTLDVKINLPIPRMEYDEAMNKYGSDAPDLRFGLELIDLTDIAAKCEFKVFNAAATSGGIVKAIRVPGGASFSRKDLDDLTEFTKIYKAKGMAWVKMNDEGWQSPITKFFSEEEIKQITERTGAELGDLILFGADKKKIVHDSLGNLRKEVAKRLGLVDDSVYNLVWVTDFPMFEMDEDEKKFSPSHHPFTMPRMEDLEKYGSEEPQNIKSIAYDIVCNGVELGGGSVRIHHKDTQEKIFRLLKISEEEARAKFGFFVDALEDGAPPHAGLAIGFDRFIMFLAQTSSIRDVIAFPKTQNAACLLTDAPSEVDKEQLKELHLAIRQSKQ